MRGICYGMGLGEREDGGLAWSGLLYVKEEADFEDGEVWGQREVDFRSLGLAWWACCEGAEFVYCGGIRSG